MGETHPTPEPDGTPTPRSTGVDPAHLTGRWDGVNSIPALGEMAFVVTFSGPTDGLRGTMDIPAQGAFGLDLLSVEFESGLVRFELETPVGLAVWEGELRNGVVEGDFTQAGLKGTFQLRRSEGQAPSPEEAADARFPREEVAFSNGDILLAGELTLPEGVGPHPVVVLISGSGPQDRDSNLYGFRVFAALAEHLAEAGIASLRFDDRGVGGSTGDSLQATVHDRAGDVEAAVDLLRSRDDIDAHSVGLVGHSEGGIVAPIVASRSDSVAFVVLLAAPMLPGDELLVLQLRTFLEMNGATEDEIEQGEAQQRLLFRAAATGQGWDEVEASLFASAREQLEALPSSARESISDEDAYLSAIVAQQMALAQSPSFAALVEYDPWPVIAALDVPVIALYGELDVQVPADVNAIAFREAVAESSIPHHTLATVPAGNHLFQKASTGSVTEYAQLKPEFTVDFLEVLLAWLTDQVVRE